ncbi:hypothetical protein AAHZ94_30970, partial [Streptomyces sp. HSW2009]
MATENSRGVDPVAAPTTRPAGTHPETAGAAARHQPAPAPAPAPKAGQTAGPPAGQDHDGAAPDRHAADDHAGPTAAPSGHPTAAPPPPAPAPPPPPPPPPPPRAGPPPPP